jgi:hypothetical protein
MPTIHPPRTPNAPLLISGVTGPRGEAFPADLAERRHPHAVECLVLADRIVRRYVRRMSLAAWFAERSVRGMLTRAVGAWILIGLPVVAARLWWSVAAALAIFIVGVTVYVTAAARYMRRHPRTKT